MPHHPQHGARPGFYAGLAGILASAAAFGAMPIFARHAYAHGIDTTVLLAWRFAIATAVLTAVVLWRRTALPRGRQLLGLVLMGGVGYVGQSFCYFTALHHAEPGLVAILLYLYPFFVAILASRMLHQRLGARRWVLLALAFAGASLTIGGGRGEAIGVALGLGAAAIYALYIVAGARLTRGVDAIASSTVVCAAAALVYGVLAAVKVGQGAAAPLPADAVAWANVLAIAVLSTAVAILGFLYGLRLVGPTNASMLSTIEPVVTMVLAWVALDEAAGGIAILGAALTLLAVIVLARQEGRALHAA
ncbi:MAG: DMT family transporter [Betaproteobacteria bacterium]|nr:DMT family transporter [Betaproteobacteria bacterium]